MSFASPAMSFASPQASVNHHEITCAMPSSEPFEPLNLQGGRFPIQNDADRRGSLFNDSIYEESLTIR